MALLQTLVLDRVSRCTSFLDVMQTEGWALSDEDYGLGERRGAETKGLFDDARLTANIAGEVEERGLSLAKSTHNLELFGDSSRKGNSLR